jgi:hypothetical protein
MGGEVRPTDLPHRREEPEGQSLVPAVSDGGWIAAGPIRPLAQALRTCKICLPALLPLGENRLGSGRMADGHHDGQWAATPRLRILDSGRVGLARLPEGPRVTSAHADRPQPPGMCRAGHRRDLDG